MATAQFDAPQNSTKNAVVISVGGAISGAVSVVVDTSKPKSDILITIEAIRARIVEGKWPVV